MSQPRTPVYRRAFFFFAILAASGASARLATGNSTGGHVRVNSVSPSSGFIGGGMRVSIFGQGFSRPLKVWVGFTPCESLQIVSPSQLQCLVPAHPIGEVDVILKTAHDYVIHRNAFTYIPNLLMSPGSASVVEGSKAAYHTQGGIPPYSFSMVQGNCTIDPQSGILSATTVDSGVVRVTDSAGNSTEASYFVYPKLKVFPDSAQVTAPAAVTITGYHGDPPFEYELVSGPGKFYPDRRLYVATTGGTAVIHVTDAIEQSQDVQITVQEPKPVSPRLVAVGDAFSCAAPNGSVSCWGSNGYQQLGRARSTSENASVPVESLDSGVVSIAAGTHHACVLVDGGVKCWGGNEYGQLGDGMTTPSAIPRQVIGLESGVLAIVAGDFHTCAILWNSAVCWGRNDDGQLGDGTGRQSTIPVRVLGLGGKITAMAGGASHTCAIVDGVAKCWGGNHNGQLGTGNQVDQWTPVPVLGLGSDVREISAGRSHTCAATSNELRCWGFNGTGNLGASTAADKSKPYEVEIASPVSALASRQYHSCAVTANSLYCWGYNYQGQVGDSSYLNRWKPVEITGFPTQVRDVSTSNFHSCAVLSDNQVYCWGDDYYGELGDGKSTAEAMPVRVINEDEKREMLRKAREAAERQQNRPVVPKNAAPATLQ